MLKKRSVQDALKQSLQTEKNAMDFYAVCASRVTDPESRRFFEQLAAEEREHAQMFYDLYDGTDLPSFEEFIEAPPDYECGWVALLRTAGIEFTPEKAMALALEREGKLERVHRTNAMMTGDPDVRAIFYLNARETRLHLERLESRQARVAEEVSPPPAKG